VSRRSARRSRSGERGAVMVESLVAIPMLLAFFAMIVQLAYLSIASLTVQHAAVVAARSASVIIPDMPTAFDDQSKVGAAEGDRLAAITEAVTKTIAALKPLPTMSLQGESAFQPDAKVVLLKDGKEAKDFEPEGVVQARVEYEYTCAVMFGGSLICGTDGKVTLTALAAMPIQGASYGYY
jgi:hypothetical protein